MVPGMSIRRDCMGHRDGGCLGRYDVAGGGRPATSAVAILTSSDSPRDRDAAIGLGANLYIRKPSDLDSFLAEVGHAIVKLAGGTERAVGAR